MAPATESIMSSLPQAHAGVGAAMNDTTRMVGGSLGVAVLGSLLSSGYRGDMESVTADLPAQAGAAEDSLGAASAIAERVGGDTGAALGRAADAAFTSAMGDALMIGAAVALAGAALAFKVMPRGAPAAAPSEAAEARREEAVPA